MSETAKPPRRQCRTCPWIAGNDPHDIPDGYCTTKHAGMADTIAQPGEMNISGPLRIMACHYSTPEDEIPCVGWLANQLGPGNNIGLRMAVHFKRVDANFELAGEQHECFEDTLPPDAPPPNRRRRKI